MISKCHYNKPRPLTDAGQVNSSDIVTELLWLFLTRNKKDKDKKIAGNMIHFFKKTVIIIER